jgi:hypothetical protein
MLKMSIPQKIKDIYANQFAIISVDAYTEARPYPYDTAVNLTVTDGGAADTFGAYALTFAAGTYDFGDNPNYVHISMIILEDIPANDTYIIEFYESPDAVAFQPIGAIRFVRVAPFTPTAYLALPLRPFNNDTNGLYARVKDATGAGLTVTYSVEIKRWFPPSGARLRSAGVWPFG